MFVSLRFLWFVRARTPGKCFAHCAALSASKSENAAKVRLSNNSRNAENSMKACMFVPTGLSTALSAKAGKV